MLNMNRLKTERLILRNFEESDLNDYQEYVCMENVGPRAGWPAYSDIKKALTKQLML